MAKSIGFFPSLFVSSMDAPCLMSSSTVSNNKISINFCWGKEETINKTSLITPPRCSRALPYKTGAGGERRTGEREREAIGISPESFLSLPHAK